MPVNPIPDTHRGATPYLICKGAAAAIDFYQRAFGAELVMKMDGPGGVIGHAEMKIGDARWMMADEFPQMGAISPKTLGGTPVSVYIYVRDVDALFAQASAAGVKTLRPPENQFYGDRSCHFEDPFGHKWGFATHVEDVSAEDMKARHEKLFGQKG